MLSTILLTVSAYQPSPSLELRPNHLPKPGIYAARVNGDHAAWSVRGSNFTIDLAGRTLAGSAALNGRQDAYEGIGLLLTGCSNVTVKNAHIGGFQFNLVMRDCKNVRIIDCTLNESRAIRMGRSGKAIDTFLNLRDLKAWRTYGAGVWAERCDTCRIERCSTSQAQNGILLVDSRLCTVTNNMCSYNGGWGIGIWNGIRNDVFWNHADFCNRPWAGNWGGDAAGIVVVNGSRLNGFIANSITHGGDGFFLTDRVNGGYDSQNKTYKIEGSSDRNMVAYNDGSWSSNNAFEGTFSSSNIYFKNIANDSNYGFWLGFSTQAFVVQNEILRNRTDGVAIGQGKGNTVFRNQLVGNGGVAVHIWSDAGPVEADQPSDMNTVIQNRIERSRLGVSLERSTNFRILGNTFVNAPLPQGVEVASPTFAQTQLLAGWFQRKDANRANRIYGLRPPGWRFYRDSGAPTGSGAVKIGDYCPARR
ncbi:MAG: NosD domain-containing protein [Fimbriimonas sp.]|nr:NosD domain-containing protein [Fimbriimonas sp.]